MDHEFNRYQKSMALALMFCAFLVVPLSAGLVYLTQLSRNDTQISAAPVSASKCDLNGDLKVDSVDYDAAALGFGKVSEDAGNARADIDGDGWINSLDLGAIEASSTLCSK